MIPIHRRWPPPGQPGSMPGSRQRLLGDLAQAEPDLDRAERAEAERLAKELRVGPDSDLGANLARVGGHRPKDPHP